MRVKATLGFYVLSAAALLILPLPWITAILVSSLVHELGHYLALRFIGVPIAGLGLTAGGAYLHVGEMNPMQEASAALSGPLGGLSLLLLSRWIPRTAICAAIQSAYHLLPLYPLDGGRAVRGLVRFMGWPEWLCLIPEWITAWILLMAGLLFLRTGLGMWLSVGAAAVIFRVFREKYLAKSGGTGYNSSTNQCEVRL